MLNRLLLFALALVVCIPAATSQIPVSSAVSNGPYCISVPVAAVVGAVGSSAFQFCLVFPSQVSRQGDTYWMSSSFTGPAVALATTAFSIVSITGCTAGTITQAVGAIGTTAIARANVQITTTSLQCTGVARWSITVSGATTSIDLAFFTNGLEQVGDFTVDILDDTTNDGLLTVPVGNVSVGDTVVNNNITNLVNNTGTGSGTVAGGFNGSLYILVMTLMVVFMHVGELRRDNNYRVIAGFIALIAGFILFWEPERARLGFNNILDGYGLGFAIGWIGVHFWLGIYLMMPKTWEKENETNG